MATASSEMQCDVYGLRIRVSGDWPEIVEALRRDFAWFPQSSGAADVEVRVRRRQPELDGFGPLEATGITWRSAEYRDGERTVVDYLGRAIAVDDGAGTFTIDGDHGWFVWRASYEYLLRATGEHFDRIGLARVNGLGLAGRDGGVLVILEGGGGKTTLALRALSDGVGLVSEGSPLLDAEGCLHPFPVPLLVRGDAPEAVSLPDEHVRRIPDIDPDPLSLEVSAFADQIPADPVVVRHVVFGIRSLAVESTIVPVPWRRVLPAAGRAIVGGHGLLGETRATGAPARVWASRHRVAALVATLRNGQAWRLTLGLDKDANWDALSGLL